MRQRSAPRYRADITAGSLKVTEKRECSARRPPQCHSELSNKALGSMREAHREKIRVRALTAAPFGMHDKILDRKKAVQANTNNLHSYCRGLGRLRASPAVRARALLVSR